MSKEKSAGFLIFRRVNSQIEYMLLKASEMDKNWTPPKGHVVKGETYMLTALRETKEEAGYSHDDLIIYKDHFKKLHYKVGENEKSVIYVLAQLKDPHKKPRLSHEHTEYRWLTKEEAVLLNRFDDFAEMIDHFHDKIEDILATSEQKQ